MPTELFARISSATEHVVLPTTEEISGRGRRRRRRHWTVAACAIIVATVTVFGGMRLFPQPVEPTDMLHFERPVKKVSTTADDKRMYAAWLQDDGHVKVGAIDFRTGGRAWPTVDLGVLGELEEVMRQGNSLVVIIESGKIQDSGDTPPILRVVDPTTGAVHDGQGLTNAYSEIKEGFGLEDSLVLVNRKAGRTTAIDPLTGAVRWTADDPLSPVKWSTSVWQDSTTVALPSELSHNERRDPPAKRLVQVLQDGRVQIRDGRTGAMTKSDLIVPQGKSQVIDGTMYVVAGTTLQTFPLNGSAPGPLLTFAEEASTPRLCGSHLVCVSVPSARYPEGVRELVALRSETGQELWRYPIGTRSFEAFTDKGILLRGEGGQQVLSPITGRKIHERPSSDRLSMSFLTSDTLFVLEWGSPSSVLSAFSFATGEERPLGTLDLVGGCAWRATTIYCPTATGFVKLTA